MPALRASALLMLLGGAWLAFSALANEPRVQIALEGPRYQYEPATIRIRITVERDPANRALTVALISEGFETSSLEELAGVDAPRTRWITYRDVPSGGYTVLAEVQRPSKGLLRAVERVTVLSRF